MLDGVCLLAQVLEWPVSVLILLLEDKGCRGKQVSAGISLSAGMSSLFTFSLFFFCWRMIWAAVLWL